MYLQLAITRLIESCGSPRTRIVRGFSFDGMSFASRANGFCGIVNRRTSPSLIPEPCRVRCRQGCGDASDRENETTPFSCSRMNSVLNRYTGSSLSWSMLSWE